MSPPDAVNVVESPSQMATSAPAFAVGNGLTVTVTESLSVQPLVVTVTEYTVVELGLTLILAVVAPVLHKYVSPPEAVSVVESPSHKVTSAQKG